MMVSVGASLASTSTCTIAEGAVKRTATAAWWSRDCVRSVSQHVVASVAAAVATAAVVTIQYIHNIQCISVERISTFVRGVRLYHNVRVTDESLPWCLPDL